MTISPDISSKLAIDAKSIDNLHLMAKQNPDEALQKVAQQFEALFMNMLLKSMREAMPKDGLFDSQQTQFFTQMYDQQLAQHIATKGIGIADMMVQQLTRANQSTESQTSVNQADAISSTFNFIQPPTLIEDGHPKDQSGQLWPITAQSSSNTTVPAEEKLNPSGEMFGAPVQMETQSRKSSNHLTNFIDKLLPHARTVSESTGIL